MLFSAPVGVSDISFGGRDYPVIAGMITVPDAQSTPALVKDFALAGVNQVLAGAPVTPGGTSFVLAPATPTALGGVKQGAGVTIAPDGTLTVAPGNAATSVLATGSIAARSIADRFAGDIAHVNDYMPNATMVWGTGVSRPLSTVFATLALAQAVYPAATALSQEIDQHAIIRAHDVLYAGVGGTVLVPIGTGVFSADISVLVKANRVRIEGAHASLTRIDNGAGSVAATPIPAFFVTGAYDSGGGYSLVNFESVLCKLSIFGRNLNPANPYGLTPGILSHQFATLAAAQAAFPAATSLDEAMPGLPATGFAPGSSGVHTENLFGFKFDRVTFNMLDRPTTWGNNCWLATLLDCNATACNKGAVWDQVPTRLNSAENIQWVRGVYANNNYNIFIDASTADGQWQGGSYVFDGPSNDYPFVYWCYFKGGSYNLSQTRLLVSGGNHWESGAASTGADTPVYIDNGIIFFTGTTFQWSNGNTPRGIVTSLVDRYAQNGIGAAYFDKCILLGTQELPYGVSPSSETWAKLGYSAPPAGYSSGSQFICKSRDCSYQQGGLRVQTAKFNGGVSYPFSEDYFCDFSGDGGTVKPWWEGSGPIGLGGSGNFNLDNAPVSAQNGAPITFIVLNGGPFTWSSQYPITVPLGKIAKCSIKGFVRAYALYGSWTLSGDLDLAPLINAANDAAAAAAGVAVNQQYRNGSVVMVRLT